VELRNHYPKIQNLKGEVLVIAPLEGVQLLNFVTAMQLPFPVLADPLKRVYRAYGLERGLAINLDSLIKFFYLVWQEKRFYIPHSDPLQIGGDFVIDPKGQIQFFYTSADPLDRPSGKEIIEVIKTTL
jgi:peroxiredoxin